MKRDMAAALIIRGGRVLLVHNTKHGGLRIEPPGGKKHADEGWEEGVEREVREELGVRVRPVRLFGTYSTHSPEGEFTVRLYLCEIISGEPRVMEPEKIPGFGWYSIDEIEGLKEEGSLVPNMTEALDDLKKHLGG
ncbi:MAG: NUDIX domain-containing protein [Thermodesulfobacteriota bacterium]